MFQLWRVSVQGGFRTEPATKFLTPQISPNTEPSHTTSSDTRCSLHLYHPLDLGQCLVLNSQTVQIGVAPD